MDRFIWDQRQRVVDVIAAVAVCFILCQQGNHNKEKVLGLRAIRVLCVLLLKDRAVSFKRVQLYMFARKYPKMMNS